MWQRPLNEKIRKGSTGPKRLRARAETGSGERLVKGLRARAATTTGDSRNKVTGFKAGRVKT